MSTVVSLDLASLNFLLVEDSAYMQVFVKDNNVDQALKVLKKKMQREGILREIKQRKNYEKPSERRVREKAEATRRARKVARKKAQHEGLLPMPKAKARPARRPGGAPSSTGSGSAS